MKLFVTYVDFNMVYDLVPHCKLVGILKRLGCGMVMLASLVALYNVTKSVVGGILIASTFEVRQGSLTPCLLFIIFVDKLIKIVKQSCLPDGLLCWLHTLVLMDNTVLLATSRERMIGKIKLSLNFCSRHGMVINGAKTFFFVVVVVSGSDADADPLHRCSSYIYLGSQFTSDGSFSSAVRMDTKTKLTLVLKLVSFIKKNNDVPNVVKKRVFDAALMSALLYGC